MWRIGLAFILLVAGRQISAGIAPEAQNAVEPPKCYSCEGINCLRTTLQNVTASCTDKLDVCVTIFEDCKL